MEIGLVDLLVSECGVDVPVILELPVQLVELFFLLVGLFEQLGSRLLLGKQDIRMLGPSLKLLQLFEGIEDLENLHSVDQPDPLDAFSIVRSQQFSEDDKFLTS
jgi:hypothetical protein